MPNIVIVDDDRGHLELLTVIAFEFGKQVSIFSTQSFRAACEFIKHNETNILIADQLLEVGEYGTDVAEIAKCINPNTKTILISAYTEFDVDMTNIDIFVSKPINRIEFVTKLQEILEG